MASRRWHQVLKLISESPVPIPAAEVFKALGAEAISEVGEGAEEVRLDLVYRDTRYFKASYSIGKLIGKTTVDVSGIALDLFIIIVPSSTPAFSCITDTDQHVKFRTFIPRFKHLFAILRATMLCILETLMRFTSGALE